MIYKEKTKENKLISPPLFYLSVFFLQTISFLKISILIYLSPHNIINKHVNDFLIVPLFNNILTYK